MYRIGLIGFGKIATDRHVPTIRAHPAFELAGVADPHADLSGCDMPVFRSHRDMLASLPQLDAVAICTPPPVRAAIAADALAAGKHVLLEKPPTPDIAALVRLRGLAEQAGRVLFTAWHSHFNEAVTKARDLLRDEIVQSVSVTWNEDFRRYHLGQDWIWRAGGFGVLDAGINALSILTRILPQAAVVRSAELSIPVGAEMPVAARIALGFDGFDGARGDVELDWRPSGGERREMAVVTRAGSSLHLVASGGRLIVDGTVAVEGERGEYPQLYSHFERLLRDGTSEVDAAPLALALDTLRLGRRVEVEAVA